ncbi:MAG: hypothetical protein HY340_00730 [Candidatus Kerfeldbacteria bacterium]|nr:hypothetical protein [Candidatus Kerfeldbacteria bacterium]
MTTRTSTLLAITLILLGAATRFLPHPANVAPIAAIALFSGAALRRWYAFVVPVAAMIVSDAVIGFHSIIWATWGSFALSGVIGFWIRRRLTPTRVIAGSLASSVLFSLITNWAVWAYTPLYDKTLAGLGASYVAAIPFFRNTVLGDLFYTGALFGLYALCAVALGRRMRPVIAHTNDGPR